MARAKVMTGLMLALASACSGSHEPKASLPAKSEAPPAAAPASEPAAAEAAATTPANAPAAAPTAGADTSFVYRLTGAVASVRKSQLAFRVNGFIDTVVAKPGMLVKKGDVLATLDDRDFALKLELAKAKRDTAKIAVDEAEKEFQREQQLKKENASTATTFDKIKAAYEQAKLQLKLAQLDLDMADLALKDTKLTAPYDCVVAQQLKFDGENLQSGTAVLEIYDTAEPEISLSAPERLIGQLKVGSELKVSVPSAAYAGQASIVRMVPVISEKTRTFQVIAKLGSYDPKIVPGSYAEATVN